MIAPTSRTALLGAVLGLVCLGLLVAFALGLPESSSDSEDVSSAPITLPGSLPGEWTAVDVVSPDGEADDAEQFAKDQQEAVGYVNGVLGEVYDAPTAFRAYANDSRTAFVTLTAFDAPGGAFAPNGFTDPERAKLARPQLELVRVDDTVCQVNWDPIPEGEEVPADDVPLGTSCQVSDAGRTFQMGTQGMSVQNTVDLLAQAVDATK